MINSYSAGHFGRGIVMPNLKPPITTAATAVAYRESIMKALPANCDFTPLMTLYLTDKTSPNEIKLASESATASDLKPVSCFYFLKIVASLSILIFISFQS